MNNLQPPLISTHQITKVFPGVRALDGVDFYVREGEVLGLVGENGAGKTTLMRILGGVYPLGSYGGSFSVKNQKAEFLTPLDAEEAGIAIIHQELSVFSDLSVAENMFMGHLPMRGLFVDWPKLMEQAKFWLNTVGAACRPEDKMESLTVGNQQLVEIAKALARKSHVLILDEPTSALSQRECDRLFSLIDQLKKQGRGLIYISHKMDEIFKLCDHVVVLRDGKTVFESKARSVNQKTLISHMVGRDMDQQFPPRHSVPTSQGHLMSVEGLNVHDSVGHHLVKNVSFKIRKGEIFGLAGLMGSGRSETLQAIFGNPQLNINGSITIDGKVLKPTSQRQALQARIALVPEDRKRQSIFPNRSLDENASQTRLALRPLFSKINRTEERKTNDASFTRFRVKAHSSLQTIETLSGGNQQKVVLARLLQMKPQIILLDEPTRGVDVGAKFEIYEILFSLAEAGHGLVVVSSELPELMGISDRIGVLNEGHLKHVFEREQFNPQAIMSYAIGSS